MSLKASKGDLTLFVLIVVGVILGLSVYIFLYAKGYSYLSDDPTVCVNCHVMKDNWDSWQKSTHHHVAKCNDCHLPHHTIGKYAVKALNGFNHSVAFTLQNFHEPIQIKSHSLAVVKNSCLSCHEGMLHTWPHENQKQNPNDISCLHCHRGVGHAR